MSKVDKTELESFNQMKCNKSDVEIAMKGIDI